MPPPLPSWSIRAVNLAEHADNPVHTDSGGRAAGYDGAVVAGTTVYAYLTRPAAQAWGEEWVTGGTATVRFLGPVLADDLVELAPVEEDGAWRVEARLGEVVAATCTVAPGHERPGEPAGRRLEPLVVELDDRWVGYAARAGEDLAIYREDDLVHPVVWPSLANRIYATQLVDGAWVHTRSRIRHLGAARPGDVALVEAFEIDRFETRSGERSVCDVRVSIDGRPVAAVEHEALVRLRA
ncbi:MAG: hypothetical protein AAF548_19805 [Actinomycetota bacterium]